MTTTGNIYNSPEQHAMGAGETNLPAPVLAEPTAAVSEARGEARESNKSQADLLSDSRGGHTPPADPEAEREEVITEFVKLLMSATHDGSRKRQAGQKPSWKVDSSHIEAAYRHIGAVAAGKLWDKDSKAHHYIHAAWRLLAVAWQDIHQEQIMRDLYEGKLEYEDRD
jgi:hypothetical protein